MSRPVIIEQKMHRGGRVKTFLRRIQCELTESMAKTNAKISN
jgi:hypothetical protein